MLESDEKFMKLALSLAEKGRGYVNPNPLVGAVIVKDGKVIGEGYHTAFGKSHAEIEAINSATEDIKGATMYVTLEPCMMCMGAIIESRIKSVYYGTERNTKQMYDKITVNSFISMKKINNIECSKLLSDFFEKKRKKW